MKNLVAFALSLCSWAVGVQSALAACAPAPPPTTITTICELQNVGLNATTLAASYVLGNDIDASETATWNNGAGFAPIGDFYTPFTGTLDGQGHTITGLSILNSATGGLGLFFDLYGTVENISLHQIKLVITDPNFAAGGIVAINHGTILKVSVTGSISTTSGATYAPTVGGIVGDNDIILNLDGSVYKEGIVEQCFASVSVTTASSEGFYGGLVGYNNGVVSGSYTTGPVIAISLTATYSSLGGLVGTNSSGTILNSYASGDVIGDVMEANVFNGSAGGLSGDNYGNIYRSFATGNVSGSGNFAIQAGGIVGFNSFGTIQQSYSTGNASGVLAGGDYAFNFIGGFVGLVEGGQISQSYSTGRVSGSASGSDSVINAIGGFIGEVDNCSPCAFSSNASYWDTDTSGTTMASGYGPVAGVNPKTTTQLQSALPSGFDPSAWSIVPGISYPVLGPLMNDPSFLIPKVHSSGHVFAARLVTFQSPLNLVTISKMPYTIIPMGQLQPWQYYNYNNIEHVSPPKDKLTYPDEACLGAVHAMIVRLIGQAHPSYSLSCPNDLTSLMCSSVVNPPSGYSEPFSAAHIEWFLDRNGNAIWPYDNTDFSNAFSISGPLPINDAAVIDMVESGHPVLLHGSATGSGPGHWMLATSVITDPATGAVTRLVATDPWLGQQVMIDMAKDRGYHSAVMNPTGSGDPSTYEALSNFNFNIFQYYYLTLK